MNIFGYFIPLPLTFLIGKGYAEEIATDNKTFDMITHITHPWWGKIYEYKGRFKVIEKHGYDVAKACIAWGCHYIDLADGREFVDGISALDALARENNVLVVSGASSVPCLTSALVDHWTTG